MMGTLRNSSSKLFSDNNYRYRESRFASTTRQIHSLLLPFKHVNLSFSPSISLPQKTTHLISPLSSLSSPDKQTDIGKEDQGQDIEDIDQSRTVRVKFQLERKCSFGQQFLIVGDDHMFGLWNPSNALQLNWSDGHIWTVELDVPIGKSIKFKFLLKGNTEEEDILWQPGPDRILQTWETDETICVCEDWDNADLQKLTEEESSSYTIDTSMVILAENSTQPIVSHTNNEEEEATFAIGANGRAMNVKDLESNKDEGKMGSYEGVLPVLVPGLTPLPIANTDEEEESTNEVEKSFCTDGAGEAKALDLPETQVVVDTDAKETTEMVPGDKQEPSQNEEAEKLKLAEEQGQTFTAPSNNGVLENDIQWGLQTLQKFLSNFGIL